MNFGEFYNLTESEKDGVFANVSKRLDDLEKRIDSAAKPGDVPKYTCVPSQSEENDILIIIDVEKGTMAGRLNTRGRLISHPLVYGDKVAFAIQREVGGRSDRLGVIHLLPSGQVHNQFRITGDAAEGTKTNPIFRKEEDTENIWNKEVEKWIDSLDADDPDIIALRSLIMGSAEVPTQQKEPTQDATTEPEVSTATAEPEFGQSITRTADMSPRQEVPTWAQAARADLARKNIVTTSPQVPTSQPVQRKSSPAAERIKKIRQLGS